MVERDIGANLDGPRDEIDGDLRLTALAVDDQPKQDAAHPAGWARRTLRTWR